MKGGNLNSGCILHEFCDIDAEYEGTKTTFNMKTLGAHIVIKKS